MRCVKLTGPMLLVALALAILAPSATASAGFDFEEFPATVHASGGTATFEMDALKVTCKVTLATSVTAPGNTETLSVTPTYTECLSKEVAMTITATGCSYVLHVGEETAADEFAGTADLSCPGESVMKVSGMGCEAKIDDQTGLNSVKYTNNTAPTPDDVTVSMTLSGVKYNRAKDEGACPFSGTGVKENGTLTQTSLVKSSNPEFVATGIFVVQAAILCEANKAKCELEEAYPSGTFIEGSATNAFFKVGSGGTPEITCGSSVMTGKTTDIVGHPNLPATIETLSFSNCVEKGTAKACSVASLSTPYAAFLAVRGANKLMKTFVRLRIICNEGATKYNCDYGDYERGSNFSAIGGNPGSLEIPAIGPASLSKITRPSEENCSSGATWSGTYSLLKPKPVWFTN